MSQCSTPELRASASNNLDVILDAVQECVGKTSDVLESSSSSSASMGDKPVMLLQPSDSVEEVNPSDSVEEVNPSDLVEEINPSDSVEEVNPSDSVEEANLSGLVEEVNYADPSEDAFVCARSRGSCSTDISNRHLDDSNLNKSGLESVHSYSSRSVSQKILSTHDLVLCENIGVSTLLEKSELSNCIVSGSTNSDSSLMSSNTDENQAVLVNLVINRLDEDTKDTSLNNKRNRVLSKLAKYYEPPLPPAFNLVLNEKEMNNNKERRFVLLNSADDKTGTEILESASPKKKSVSFKSKIVSSPQYSPGKYSPGNFSPSRRTSIMHPLTYSPSSSDHPDKNYTQSKYFVESYDPNLNSKRSSSLLNNDTDSFPSGVLTKDSPECKKRKSGSEEVTFEVNRLFKSAIQSSSQTFETKLNPCEVKTEKKTKLKNRDYIHRRKKRGIPTKGPTKSNGAPLEYEVEYLESHKVLENNQCVFLVKWVGWDSCDNSWEPITNLLNCQEKLVDYFEKLQKAGNRQEIEILLHNSALSELRQTLSKASDEEMNRLLTSFSSNDCLKLPSPNKEFIEKTLHLLSKQRPENVAETLKDNLRQELLLEKLWLKRKVQLNALKEWELEINFLAQNSALITVENNVDLEGPPPNFHYIDHYLPGAGVIIPNDPPCGCDCSGSCTEKSQNCCTKEFGFAYDHNGRIKVPRGTPIYECNSRCSCSQKCLNRVIQKGQHYRLCIFKTSNGCGWGVKSLENIKKGSFITKYVGEVITADEAAVRARSETNKFYLFDLDFNHHDSSTCPFTVDASVYGNISHFVNHSCDPNLAIYAAWINCLDPNIPLLVLFAVRDIQKGEELCFSYSRTDKRRKGTKAEIKCKCNAANCRKYVF